MTVWLECDVLHGNTTLCCGNPLRGHRCGMTTAHNDTALGIVVGRSHITDDEGERETGQAAMTSALFGFRREDENMAFRDSVKDFEESYRTKRRELI